jgi:hypothetical protein
MRVGMNPARASLDVDAPQGETARRNSRGLVERGIQECGMQPGKSSGRKK